MNALAQSILPTIRAAVAPVPAEDYRPDTVTDSWVWVRPPSTSAGTKPAQKRYRQGLVTVDVWRLEWSETEATEAAIVAAMSRFVSPEGYSYKLQSSVPVLEPDMAHQVLTFGVLYDDLRGAA